MLRISNANWWHMEQARQSCHIWLERNFKGDCFISFFKYMVSQRIRLETMIISPKTMTNSHHMLDPPQIYLFGFVKMPIVFRIGSLDLYEHACAVSLLVGFPLGEGFSFLSTMIFFLTEKKKKKRTELSLTLTVQKKFFFS